jgi:hypothetical protein
LPAAYLQDAPCHFWQEKCATIILIRKASKIAKKAAVAVAQGPRRLYAVPVLAVKQKTRQPAAL